MILHLFSWSHCIPIYGTLSLIRCTKHRTSVELEKAADCSAYMQNWLKMKTGILEKKQRTLSIFCKISIFQCKVKVSYFYALLQFLFLFKQKTVYKAWRSSLGTQPTTEFDIDAYTSPSESSYVHRRLSSSLTHVLYENEKDRRY